MCAKLRAERSFKFELPEQRFDTALELRVVCDDICKMRTPYFLCFLRAERSHQKVPPVVHRARAHAQIKFEVGNKSSDLVAGRLAEARTTREPKQRVCVLFVLVGGERSRLRPGWRRELSADSERRFHLRDWLSACDVLRSGLRRVSAHTERRFGLRELCAHTERRSGLRRVSAHTERRSGLRRVSALTERRSNLRGLSAHTERRSVLQGVSACKLRSNLRGLAPIPSGALACEG